jgi:hypothetical protein
MLDGEGEVLEGGKPEIKDRGLYARGTLILKREKKRKKKRMMFILSVFLCLTRHHEAL